MKQNPLAGSSTVSSRRRSATVTMKRTTARWNGARLCLKDQPQQVERGY
ncbi:MAG: hypothetical protein KIS67_11995 [Verrucomicrobiae bacterium]|nr:hypothetical protein [Verrucomicrobiae bacterium]